MNDFIDLPHLPECLLGLPLETIHEIHSHTYHAIKADRQQRGEPRAPDGFRLVNEDELIELSDSILGNYYRGQDWERERITNMLAAAPKFGEEE